MPLPTYSEALDLFRSFFDDKGDRAKATPTNLEGEEGVWTLPGGSILMRTDLDLDTDGPKLAGIRYESTHQDQTSLRWPGGMSVSSHLVPYVVLPGGWGERFGLDLGDVGLCLYNNRVAHIICADTGPRGKIGEGSIALHEALGFDRVRGGRIVDVGIDRGVRTWLIPGSGSGVCLAAEKIEAIVSAAWARLKEKAK